MLNRVVSYFHATADGQRDSCGRVYAKVREGDVPGDAPVTVFVFGEGGSDQAALDKHWTAFRKAIDAGKYVRLAHAADAREMTPFARLVHANAADEAATSEGGALHG